MSTPSTEPEPPMHPHPLPLCLGLRSVWREGYTAATLRSDILAGIVVGIIALPLSMALAIASGVPPQMGIYTAIIGGFVIGFFGGSRVQVSGPTAAFVVILAPIAAQHGPGGLLLAGLLAGVILIGLGAFGLGRLVEFIPNPVTTGFTAGIAVVIATIQAKDFLGLEVVAPDHYTQRVIALANALPTTRGADAALGVLTLAILIVWPRVTRRVPAALVALCVATLAGYALTRAFPEIQIATIDSRFAGGIPQTPPRPVWPWSLGGPGGESLDVTWGMIRDLFPSALTIAMLGAIESLLSAVVADGITGIRHDPDGELIAQGIGNLVCPFFGGIAATGALARTGASIRAGARSPVAVMVHSAFLLLAVVAFAPLLGWVPMAAMAALLIVVAFHMSEARHFLKTLRIAPRSDVAVMLTCFALTVFFDMVLAVGVGVVMAALLFMKRMAEVADVRLVGADHHEATLLPPGIVVYEIGGPLFFGAAQKATGALREMGLEGVRVVVLDMRSVPVMDATGLVSLESAVDRLMASGVHVVLAGVRKQPLHVLGRAHVRGRRERLIVRGDFHEALAHASAIAATFE